jgi:hypothetical protein
MHRRRFRLPVAGPDGRLLVYSPARLARLTEGIGGDDDLDMGDLGLDDGSDDDDDSHLQHLSAAAAAIFGNKSLSSDEKLRKLRLLLKVGDTGEEPDDDEAPGADLPAEINSAEGVIRKMWRRCRRAPRDTRPQFLQNNPGAVAMPGLLAIAEGNGSLPRGAAVRLTEVSARRRTGKPLTRAAFLKAIEGGR